MKLHGRTDKWLLRQVAARLLPPSISRRPKTMPRASRSATVLGATRAPWVDELLSPASLRTAGYFDVHAVTRECAWQRNLPMITPRRIVMDAALTAVVTTQLFHHVYLGGGLCRLSTYQPGHFTSSPLAST